MALAKQYETPVIWSWEIKPTEVVGENNIQLVTRARTSDGYNYYTHTQTGVTDVEFTDMLEGMVENHSTALEADEYELQP